MDHRTIVSFFTCQLVWVNRYSGVPVGTGVVLAEDIRSFPRCPSRTTRLEDWRASSSWMRTASSVHGHQEK